MGPVRREEDIASLSYVAPRDETGFVVAQAVYPVLRQTVEGRVGARRSGGPIFLIFGEVLTAAGGHVSHKIAAECLWKSGPKPAKIGSTCSSGTTVKTITWLLVPLNSI